MCDLAREGPLIALLPAHAEFDDEEAAAAQFLPVVRFTYADEVTFASPLSEVSCCASWLHAVGGEVEDFLQTLGGDESALGCVTGGV
mmetsp:Transcript_25032/g.66356  ORF Transcript_25032/g.66356 Transcript_25032/m.66356 type:complete len:87 (-) Transcript_25032:786-1046(-)